jgi:hypothetical protein
MTFLLISEIKMPVPSSKVLKAFAQHISFISNKKGIVNPIGELSPYSATFSKDVGYYKTAAFPEIILTTFYTKEDGAYKEPASTLVDRVNNISDFLYQNTLHTSGELYSDQIAMQIYNYQPTWIESLQIGEMVTDGQFWMPAWVSWTDVETGTYVRIWFADDSFRRHYDEFEIVVCPAYDNLNDFFQPGSKVEADMKAVTPEILFRMIDTKRNYLPETVLRAEPFDYKDPINLTRTVTVNWGILIYGPAGNNIDSIKTAIIDYIAANSSVAQSEWKKIFPDIYIRTEFTIVPDWWSYAIPERTTQAGIYSPIANLSRALDLMKKYAPSYIPLHVETYTTTINYPYKSVSMAVCSCNENRDQKFWLTDYFPDYIAVASTSPDFNRMSGNTRGFSELLSNMLIAAESMDEFNIIPTGMTRLKRDGMLYLVATYQNINYLVVAKSNDVVAEAG